MRLLRRKLWRAFPELDEFDDALCRAFVRVATSSWRARAVRYLCTAVAGLATIVVASAISGKLLGLRGQTAIGNIVVVASATLVLTTALAAGFVGALVGRDWLLRRRVRRIIRDRGGCPHCGYRLLGVPVDAECRVTCPECGQVTVVDAAMGDLVDAASGQRVYNAVLPRLDERGRRRRRRVVKAVAWVGGSALTLLLLAYGAWWIVLLSDARAARAERDGAAKWRAMIAAAQPIPGSLPPGAVVTPDMLARMDRWDEFVAAVCEVSDATRRFSDRHAEGLRLSDGTVPWVEYTLIGDDSPATPAPGQTPAERLRNLDIQRALSLAAVEELESSGVAAMLSRVRHMGVVMRPTPETDSSDGTVREALIGILLPHLGECRQSARLCVARMHLALQAGDQERYIDALDTGLALARVLDTGTTMIERLVGTAIDSLLIGRVKRHIAQYPTLEWTAAVREVLERRRRNVGLDAVVRGEQVLAGDAIKWMFAQPGKVHRAALLGDYGDLGVSGPKIPVFATGTYRANLRVVDRGSDAWAAYAGTEPCLRWGPPPGNYAGPLLLPQALTPGYTRFLASEDQLTMQHRELTVLLAIRHYEQRTGGPPQKAADLVPDELPALPLDPYTGRPLMFTVVPAVDGAKAIYAVGPEPEPKKPDTPRPTPGPPNSSQSEKP